MAYSDPGLDKGELRLLAQLVPVDWQSYQDIVNELTRKDNTKLLLHWAKPLLRK